MHFDYLWLRFAWPNIQPSANYYQHVVLYDSVIIIVAVLFVMIVLGLAVVRTSAFIFDDDGNIKPFNLGLLYYFIINIVLLYLSGLLLCGIVNMTLTWEDRQIQAQISMVNAVAKNENNRYVKITNNKPVKAVEKNLTLKMFVDEAKPSDVHGNADFNELLDLRVKYFDNSQERFNKGSVVVQYKKAKAKTHYEVYTRHVKLTKLGKKYIKPNIKPYFDDKNIAVVTIYVKPPAIKWESIKK